MRPVDAYNITVVGGAGIVGREFLKLLETRKTPVKRLRLGRPGPGLSVRDTPRVFHRSPLGHPDAQR